MRRGILALVVFLALSGIVFSQLQAATIEAAADASTGVEKPRSSEIVIKGSKIRQNIMDTVDEQRKWVAVLSAKAKTEAELNSYAETVAATDDYVEKINLTPNGTVHVDYQYPAKLLGIFEILYTATVEVDTMGKVKVNTPWWLPLTLNNASKIRADIENRTVNLNLQDSIEKQQAALQVISEISKNQHETATAVIRKIG